MNKSNVTKLANVVVFACLYLCPLTVEAASRTTTTLSHSLPQSVTQQEFTELKGKDLNNDGVRDDVALAISELYQSTYHREVFMLGAVALQKAILSSVDSRSYDVAYTVQLLDSFRSCLRKHSTLNPYKAFSQLRAIQLNTPQRKTAYSEFIQASKQFTQSDVGLQRIDCATLAGRLRARTSNKING